MGVTMKTFLCILVLCLTPAFAQAQSISRCQKADAAYQAGNHSEAVALYNQCMSERNLNAISNACAKLNRGRCYLAMGQHDKALGDIRSAVASQPALGHADKAAYCMNVDPAMAAALLGSTSER